MNWSTAGTMKKYRCVFNYAHGRTTIDVEAEDAERAVLQASRTVSDTDAVNLEIWDETGIVLSRSAHQAKRNQQSQDLDAPGGSETNR